MTEFSTAAAPKLLFGKPELLADVGQLVFEAGDFVRVSRRLTVGDGLGCLGKCV